ncbi:SDR family NAD(P)-dependent oxidoreductase [Brevibacillus dissolubilis]|uniref:SDR family NAD(P)-dependent oxidoreductase n=1 Tax=Brevibacillus dissolubilis TaxID=1844116 RepID=UPI0011178A63|nr:SDR family oxidoreductase [Brevibacillus dissolubilis]
MGKFQNQVIIITGAGAGLGRETALLLARQGACVVACDHQESKVNKLRDELAAISSCSLAIKADASVESDVDSLFAQALEAYGKVDVLINNAAVFENYLIADTSLESWNYQLTNNATSAFLMIKAALPVMRRQKSGQIMNVTSSLAKTGGAGFGAYSASKAALEALTYSVQEEEGQHGIIANVFNPGVMKSDMQTLGEEPAKVAEKLARILDQNYVYSGQVILAG